MLHAVVRNGRLVLDEPSDLPDGTVVELGIFSPSTIAPDALGFVDADLQPAIQRIYRLWEAVTHGQLEAVEFFRTSLLADLERVRDVRVASPDAIREAKRQLMGTPASEIRAQVLSGIELTLFGARLPQPPEAEYAKHRGSLVSEDRSDVG